MRKKKVESVPNIILTDTKGKQFELIPFTKEGETPKLFKISEVEDEIDRLVTLAISGIRSKHYHSLYYAYRNDLFNKEEQEVYDVAEKLRERVYGK